MKFTFCGSSGEMPHSLLTSSEPEEHCFRFWSISLKTCVGIHLWKQGQEEQSLTADDHVFILAEAALNLTVSRGMGAPEPRICYERVESLCRSVNRPMLLYSALIGKWRYSLNTDKLTRSDPGCKTSLFGGA